MKKEETGRKDKKNINQEEAFADTELSNDEFGFEYDFFITTNNIEKKLAIAKRNKPEKKEDTQDLSKAFFLPDFFSDED